LALPSTVIHSAESALQQTEEKTVHRAGIGSLQCQYQRGPANVNEILDRLKMRIIICAKKAANKELHSASAAFSL
jgi:hypothetical protein